MASQGVRRMVFALVGGALLLTGCGSGADGTETDAEQGENDPLAAGPESGTEEGPAADLTRAVNEAMSGTTFRAEGPSTAFEGGEQEMWSDPEVGVRILVNAPDITDGEVFCQDGVVYTGVPLFAAQLKASGEEFDVPGDTLDRYISVQAGGDCRSLYEIYPGAELDPERDTTVDGTPATALVARSTAGEDVYLAASEGEPYLLRMEADYVDGGGTTVYDSFGDTVDINMPPEESVMSMEEFRNLIQPG